MPTRWLIQETAFTDPTTRRLPYAVEELGMVAHLQPYVPFGGMSYASLPDDGPAVLYGSVALIRDALSRGLPHRPLAWFDAERLRCASYYAHWGRHLVQREYAMAPLGELPRLWDFLHHALGAGGAVFVRPDSNDKAFTGEVVPHEDLERFMAAARAGGDGPELLCVVSRPVAIEAEWRLVVADRKVVAGSRYRTRGRLEVAASYPEGAAALAEAAAAEWEPHPIFVLDVALTPEGYRLLEIGSLNCAGLYACDLRAVAAAAGAIAEREWRLHRSP